MFGEDANAYTQVTLNLSHQTESADLIGGFRPVDARIPGSELQARFIELFGATFSRKKNEKFETEVRKAVAEGRWKRAAGLWKESVRLARDRIRKRREEEQGETRCVLLAVGFWTGTYDAHSRDGESTPRKRRKVEKAPEELWAQFEHDVNDFRQSRCGTFPDIAFRQNPNFICVEHPR